MSEKRGNLWFLHLMAGGIAIAVAQNLGAGLGYELAYNLISSSAVAAIIYGVYRYKPHGRTGWAFLAAGYTLMTAGDTVFTVYYALVGEKPPFPSGADAAYLMAYACL